MNLFPAAVTMAHNAALSNVQGLLSSMAGGVNSSLKQDVGATGYTKNGDFIYIKHEVLAMISTEQCCHGNAGDVVTKLLLVLSPNNTSVAVTTPQGFHGSYCENDDTFIARRSDDMQVHLMCRQCDYAPFDVLEVTCSCPSIIILCIPLLFMSSFLFLLYILPRIMF